MNQQQAEKNCPLVSERARVLYGLQVEELKESPGI